MSHSLKVEQELTKHHRKCRSNGGKEEGNIIMLPRKKHEAWHTLTGNMHPKDIAILFNSYYLDPDYEFICVKKHNSSYR